MIISLELKGLFGRFNYDIQTKQEGITILTGPNGFGKSTILKIIEALYKGNLFYFFNLDFLTILVGFDNGKKVKITKSLSKKNIEIDGIEVKIPTNFDDSFNFEFVGSNFRRIGQNEWVNMKTRRVIRMDSETFDFFAFLNSNNDTDFSPFLNSKNATKLKTKLQEIKKNSGEVRLILEQRLLKKNYDSRKDEDSVAEVIFELPKKLKEEMQNVLTEYSNVANKLDSSYPSRLLSASESISQEEYIKRHGDVISKFEKLKEYNLVEMNILGESHYDARFSTALKVYFDDFAEKYKVFEGIITKIDLFTKIINARFTFKKINISQEYGFRVSDSDRPEKLINLNSLSSGEKQELILFYELIFNTKSDLLLLIDEPEISLHITWQRNFLNDLMEVAKIIKLQSIVATHAPQIIDVHRDLQIDLGELYVG